MLDFACPEHYCTRPTSGETGSVSWPLRCLCSVLFLLSESSRSAGSRSLSLFLSRRPSRFSLSFRLLRFLRSLRSLFFLRPPPGHFLLFTRHSLISEISGQGLPKGDGYWRTCRVRVSWPRLNPQVLPDREQGLHSLHSPTSQCTCAVHSMSLSLGS